MTTTLKAVVLAVTLAVGVAIGMTAEKVRATESEGELPYRTSTAFVAANITLQAEWGRLRRMHGRPAD
jgi:hypothetical protein